MELIPARICGTVIAGVHFFSPPGFRHQKPGGDEGEDLVMMPALPVTDFVVGETRFALGTLDTLFDAMLGLGRAGELRFLGLRIGVGHVVIGLDDTLGVTFSETDDDQDFCVTFLPLVRAPDHTTLDDLDDERTFRAVAHIDLGPVPGPARTKCVSR